jgi:hypothetical protein
MSFGRSHAPSRGGFTLFSPDSQYSVQWFPEIPVLSMQQNSHLTITFFLSSNVFSAYAHDFSTPDIPVMFGASIKHVLLNVCSEHTEQQGFAILCRKDQMYHEQILVMPSVLINVIHMLTFSL